MRDTMQRGLVSECSSGSFDKQVRIVDFDRHNTFGIEGEVPRFPASTSSYEIERPVTPHRRTGMTWGRASERMVASQYRRPSSSRRRA